MNKKAFKEQNKKPHLHEAFNELDGGVNLNIRGGEQTSRPGYQVFPERINK